MNGDYNNGDDRPNRRFHIDTDRFVIFLLVLAFIGVGIWYGVNRLKNGSGQYVPEIAFTTPTAEPTPEPTPTPLPTATPFNEGALSYLRPEPEAEGYLPVFSRALTVDPKVAVIVEGCGKTKNLEELLETASVCNAHLTFFPTGTEITDSEIWMSIIENGHEIENHTNANRKLYQLSQEEMENEISDQAKMVSLVLGCEYKMHFLMPYLGEGTNDKRTHEYLAKEGYRGMASWTLKLSDLKDIDSVEPGMVILLSASDKNMSKADSLIRKLADAGYEMVTMNELFGYPANERITDEGDLIEDVVEVPEETLVPAEPADEP